MSDKKNVLTKDGYNKLVEELDDLKVVKRREVAEKIKEARGQGDLSENAEYDSAKEEQAQIEARIAVIENILKTSEMIEETAVDKNKVSVGGFVTVYDYDFEEEVTYQIVGSAEANALEGKISNESPVGQALLGHKVNDEVEVATGDTKINLKIVSITK